MSDTVAQQLIAAAEFRRVLEWLSTKQHLTDDDGVLRAWAELELGDPGSALRRASQLLTGHLQPESRARCLGVHGRAQGNQGLTNDGLISLRKATSLAGKDIFVEAELLAHYVAAALSWVGVEPALAELPRLRRAALESANRPALIEYHVVHARIAALRGWWHKVHRELTAAEGLLSTHPHLTLKWRLEQVHASIAIMSGDLKGALYHAERCLELSEATGSKSHKASTFANLAHICAVAGEFERSTRFLKQSHDLLEPNNVIRFATANTGINIGLSRGDDSFVEQMLAQGEALSSASPRQAYYKLWFVLHRVRWLLHCGRFVDAAGDAEAALKSIEQLADADLSDRMKLLRAEALAHIGATPLALNLLAEVTRATTPHTLEVQAEIHRVTAVLAHRKEPGRAAEELSAAWRILTAAGLAGVRCDVERSARKLAIPFRAELCGTVSSLSGPAVVDRAASLLKLGRYPKALAIEVVALLRAMDACEGATLSVQSSGRMTQLMSFGCIAKHRGSNNETEVQQLVIQPCADTSYIIDFVARDPEAFTLTSVAIEQLTKAAIVFGTVAHDDETPVPWPSETASEHYGMIVGSDSMLELLGTARRLAGSNIPVLVTGETGTGKELLARALHDASPRSQKPFIPFNCSAVSRDLLDAQLFGYRKGAFTGAHEAFQGVIRAAAGGTLFLDEIGEITPEVQPKLLRFLESGEIHPLGEPRPIHVQVRVVAATNADLEKLVGDGRFREDLFYRLNVVRLQVPALRDRREEIPALVQHFLDRYSRESHKTGLRIADETMEYLILYKWPGNVRQLANELRRMVALAESGAVLMPEHLSQPVASSRRTIPASERPLAPTEVVVRLDQRMSAAMEHVERTMIQYALKLSGGRVEDAAERLGLSRKGLYLKRHRLHMVDLQPEERAVAAATS